MENNSLIRAIVMVLSISLLFCIVYLNNVNVKISIQNQQLRKEIELLKSDSVPTKSTSYQKKMNISAYCPCELCCGKWSDGQTSTGKDAYTKGVAVDPTIIPLGTKIYIPGYGTVIADDVGGAIKGDKLDVRFKTHREALEWGRQFKEVTIFLK